MELKNIILPEYEVRKTRAQKNRFIEMLKSRYGDRLTVEESKAFPKSRNIIIGNPDTAEVIYTAHYDTCARLPFPNFITPKATWIYILYQLILTVVLIIPPFACSYLAARYTENIILTELGLFIPLVLEMWLLMAGPANKHTANDNTSGVITVLTLAERLADNPKAAFVLFDHEEVGLIGSSEYAKKHKNIKNNGFIVNFDCVSDGDNILLYCKTPKKSTRACPIIESLKDSADEILAGYCKTAVVTDKALYPSDQASFRHSVAVAALLKSKKGILYMNKIHTDKDTVFDESNITALADLFERITNNLN